VRQRIIIIEDERDIVELVRYNFRKEGFEIESFSRGREGLEYLRRNPADLATRATLANGICKDSAIRPRDPVPVVANRGTGMTPEWPRPAASDAGRITRFE